MQICFFMFSQNIEHEEVSQIYRKTRLATVLSLIWESQYLRKEVLYIEMGPCTLACWPHGRLGRNIWFLMKLGDTVSVSDNWNFHNKKTLINPIFRRKNIPCNKIYVDRHRTASKNILRLARCVSISSHHSLSWRYLDLFSTVLSLLSLTKNTTSAITITGLLCGESYRWNPKQNVCNAFVRALYSIL